MDTQPKSLQVVSFASQGTQDTFCSALVELGHEIHYELTEAWLSGGNTEIPIPTIVLLAEETHQQKKILFKLKEPRSRTFLGVFHCCINSWGHEILYYFDDFLLWPCHKIELALRLNRICTGESISHPTIDNVREEFAPLNLIGNSPVFLKLLHQAKKAARYDIPVLIEGETGTGKELIARAIHYLGTRRDYPFIPINCGAIPDNLLENELFGHEKGAYTDAKHSQPGAVAMAQGGTLFLDEVDALSPKAQIALLRFLQDLEYKPLGGSRYKKGDIRIIAATNASLVKLTEEDRFRQDLLFRLNLLVLFMPPLRERKEDISLLADHFLNYFAKVYKNSSKTIHANVINWMERYNWPGNVRELENFIHRQFLLSDGPVIYEDMSEKFQQDRRKNKLDRRKQGDFINVPFNDAKNKTISAFEKKYLIWLMHETKGNVTQAARLAGKERRALGKLLKKYGLSGSSQKFS